MGGQQPAVLCHVSAGSEQQLLQWPLPAAVPRFTFLACCSQVILEALCNWERKTANLPCYLDLSGWALPSLAGVCPWGLAVYPRCSDQILLFAIPLIPWWPAFDWDHHSALQLSQHPQSIGMGRLDPHLLLFKDESPTVGRGPTESNGQEIPLVQRGVCLLMVTELFPVSIWCHPWEEGNQGCMGCLPVGWQC